MKKGVIILVFLITLSAQGQNGRHEFGFEVSAAGSNSIAVGMSSNASGHTSVAMGYFSEAKGSHSSAMGRGTKAYGGSSIAFGYQTEATAETSTAMGYQSKATGHTSVAMGNSSKAEGNYSTAMGNSSETIGESSTAMGFFSKAKGNYSTAMGYSSAANAKYSTAMGKSTTASGESSTAMGNSSAAIGNYSTAMGYSSAANAKYSTAMGYGTTASGESSAAIGNYSTASGESSTAMGYGTTASGVASIAMGKTTTASGESSTAMGKTTTASGDYSTVMGSYTRASDYASTVIGQFNDSGSSAISATSFSISAPAFVIGNGATSSSRSDAFKVLFNGNTTTIGSITAISFIGDGSLLTNLPSASIAFTDLTSTPTTLVGYGITDAGTGILSSVTESSNTGVRLSTAVADNHGNIGAGAVDLSFQSAASSTRGATGNYSTATGKNTTASDFASTVIGQFNNSGSSAISATSFSTSAPAFVIGNGTNSGDRSDAFKVLFNGETTVSSHLTVNGDIVVSSDARLKANIVSLGATLAKLLLIDGKSYTMKKDGKQKIGVLAQDIQKVFPELVSEDSNKMLAVNYLGLVPVLVNAIKEQDSKMKAQEKRLERLERLLSIPN